MRRLANARGHYGSARIGETTVPVYVQPSQPPPQESRSVLPWILGGLAIGGAFLWTRHQAKQIEQINQKVGIASEPFASGLRQRAASSLRALADRALSGRKDVEK